MLNNPKSLAKSIADRFTKADSLAYEISVAITDSYARGYTDALAESKPLGLTVAEYLTLTNPNGVTDTVSKPYPSSST